jgi:predicted enzyme related to lactoylglutathione lyase
MTAGVRTIIYPVRDLQKAKDLYRELAGAEPTSDAPYYVGFTVDGQNIGLDPNGHAHGMTGPLPYWHVADIDASVRALLDAGAEVVQDVKDVGGGRRIATLRDADGNPIGVLQN